VGVVLEIRSGPAAGQVIGLRTGESVTVGRAAAKAQFALAQDTFMSGLHFSVECGSRGCRVVDRKSSNGTFLNGGKIQEAMLASGDEIKAGQTVFVVKMMSDERVAALAPPLPAASAPAAPPPTPRAGVVDAEWPERGERAADAEKRSERAVEKMPEAAPEVREPRSAAGAEPGVREPGQRSPQVEVRLQEQSAPAPPAMKLPGGAPPVPPSTRDAAPPVEEPPRFHAIPKPPAGIPKTRESAAREGSGEPSVAPPATPPAMPRAREESGAAEPPRRSGAARAGGFRVMGWAFPAAPAGWLVQEGFGLAQAAGEFPGSVAATEETLAGITLQQFVELQISTLRAWRRNAKIEPALPPRVGGADETMAVDVRHTTNDSRELAYRYIYARAGASVGILTVTALAGEFAQVLEGLQPLLDAAEFQATVNA